MAVAGKGAKKGSRGGLHGGVDAQWLNAGSVTMYSVPSYG